MGLHFFALSWNSKNFVDFLDYNYKNQWLKEVIIHKPLPNSKRTEHCFCKKEKILFSEVDGVFHQNGTAVLKADVHPQNLQG